MNSEQRHALWVKIKTALLALLIITLLVLVIQGNKKNSSTNHDVETRALKQALAKLETAEQNRRDILEEAREENRNLREILSELRGIHNDCQRNATKNFLHPQRNHNAR